MRASSDSLRPARYARLAPSLAAGAALLAGVLALPREALADEIRSYDPSTLEVKTDKAFEIGEETWTQIAYRPAQNRPLSRVDTRLVLEIRRTADDAQTQAYRAAEEDLARGNYTAARNAFGQIAGGGLAKDPSNDTIAWKAFPQWEGAKTKWFTVYAQFKFAQAIYLEGKAKGDKSLLEYALRTLDSEASGEKGFLQRTKEGKSRWYADALLLRAQALLALGKYAEAAAAYDDLYQKSISQPIGPRWSFEAKLGPGQIAEAKGVGTEAESAYAAGASPLQSLLEKAPDAWSRREYGRYYNELRVQKARIMREAAEKANSPAEFARLRQYLQTGTPDALRAKFKDAPPEVIEAVVAGALAPTVQAVVQNGIGLAYLNEKKYVDALFAFNEVRVKHYAVREEVPRALYYLAQAADGAAQGATKPDAKALFQGQAAAARAELDRAWKDSPWASKK